MKDDNAENDALFRLQSISANTKLLSLNMLTLRVFPAWCAWWGTFVFALLKCSAESAVAGYSWQLFEFWQMQFEDLPRWIAFSQLERGRTNTPALKFSVCFRWLVSLSLSLKYIKKIYAAPTKMPMMKLLFMTWSFLPILLINLLMVESICWEGYV